MAVLLGTGVRGKDVIKLSQEIIKLFEEDFENINLEKLFSIHGLGLAKLRDWLLPMLMNGQVKVK